jgi:competence protein ComEC
MRDGVTFEVFAAGPRDCALRVAAGPHAILLGGGLDARAERALLSRLPAGRLASDVVLMGRGASPQASSREWIETSAARVAIAAGGLAGSASRAETLGRWRDAGIPVLDTLYEGDIEIALGMQGFAVLGTARTSRYPFAWRRVE